MKIIFSKELKNKTSDILVVILFFILSYVVGHIAFLHDPNFLPSDTTDSFLIFSRTLLSGAFIVALLAGCFMVLYRLYLYLKDNVNIIKESEDCETLEVQRMNEVEQCPDRFAELEEQILNYYLSKGYKLLKDQDSPIERWDFDINIMSKYKSKSLTVAFESAEKTHPTFELFYGKTTKEMFDNAFEFFRIEEK